MRHAGSKQEREARILSARACFAVSSKLEASPEIVNCRSMTAAAISTMVSPSLKGANGGTGGSVGVGGGEGDGGGGEGDGGGGEGDGGGGDGDRADSTTRLDQLADHACVIMAGGAVSCTEGGVLRATRAMVHGRVPASCVQWSTQAAHRLAAIVEVEHEEDEGGRHMAMPPSHSPGTTRDRTGAAPARGRSPVG